MLGAEGRHAQPGQWEAGCREGEELRTHSPSVAERRVLGLEVRGLQEDIQGFLEVTQLIQALALRRQGPSVLLITPAPMSSTVGRGQGEKPGQRLQETEMREMQNLAEIPRSKRIAAAHS